MVKETFFDEDEFIPDEPLCDEEQDEEDPYEEFREDFDD